ncbi:MAG: hypothetical protein WC692_08530 [Erythrobacter sp.]|jgi:Tol biopolymer transport system component
MYHEESRRVAILHATTALALLFLVGCGGEGTPATLAIPTPMPNPAPAPTPIPTSTPPNGQPPPDLIFTGDGVQSPTSRQELFTIYQDGSARTQLSSDGLNHFLPHYSPDGRRIAYTKFFRGGYGSADAITDVVVYDVASRIETRLTNLDNGWQPVWSPDGTRIAFGTNSGSELRLMNADGSGQRLVGRPGGSPDDLQWGDWLWSSDNWIYFVVVQRIDGCFKTRIDRIRPDGSGRVRITDGGPNCTPDGFEQSGDADPAISPDGRTIYSSRGLPLRVPGQPDATVRHLYRFSSDPYTVDKVETDLSLPAKADCIAGVPKVSPRGARIAFFLFCPSDPARIGITLTDPDGTAFTFITPGFGPDWHPTARD